MVKYSVIVPHFNDTERFKKLIWSIERQEFGDYEILVVDDYSADDSYAELVEFVRGRKNINVLRTNRNSGPASARNLGISKAKGDLLFFTDSDCVLPDGCFSSIEKFYSLDANKGKVLQGRAIIMESNLIGDSISNIGFPAGGSVGFDRMWHVNMDNETSQLITCACIIPKKVIESVGAFDTSFPVQFGEDTDLGLRVVSKGYKIIFNKEFFIYHPARDNLRSFFRWTIIRGKGAFYFRKKNSVNSFARTRLWSTKNILLNGAKSFKFPLIVFFLFSYLTVFYFSYLLERLRN